MDEPQSFDWRPEPEPQNALERLLARAAADPALHGQLMRALWDSEIVTLMPYHPELIGEHVYEPGQQMQFVIFQDKTGPFIPAFTSETAAAFCIEKNAPKGAAYGMATMQGEMFFALVKDSGRDVVFNSGMRHNLVMRPEALEAIVKGELRHGRPSGSPPQETKLFVIAEEQLPAGLCKGIRGFCDRTPVPIAVYLYHSADAATGLANPRDMRIILRLRSLDNDFYNDFSLMAGKLAPPGVELATAVVTADNEGALEFLSRCRPVWPVIAAEG